MVAVARCESNFVHYKKDGGVLRGHVDARDSGAMQINKGYHEDAAEALGYDLDNLFGNLAYARALYDKLGETPWVCSRKVAQQ